MTRNSKIKTTAQTQRMTVTAGLKELKLLNKRITSRIDDLKAIRTRRSSTETIAGVNKKDFEDAAREGFQAIQALLARRDAIKAEIVRSNAESTVTVGGQRMTVAAAIERKRALEAQKKNRRRDEDFVPTQETLVQHLRAQYAVAVAEEANLLSVMEAEREMRVNSFLNQERSKGQNQKDAGIDTKAIEDAYRAANTPVIDDPLDLLKKLASMEEDVEIFSSEVDRVLDEHNATIYIEVPASQ